MEEKIIMLGTGHGFTFDLNFDVSYKIVKENDYINILVDRFEYKDEDTKNKMEKIRKIIDEFIDGKMNLT